MSKSFRANLELGLNIVIATAIVVVAVAVVKRSAFPSASPSILPQITVGDRLNIPNVSWEKNKKSLVFFLMKDCKYCQSSAPFYRQLIEDASKRNVQRLAVLPNTVEEGRKYIESLELPIENVETGSLSSYKIPGTPAVLFVNKKGIVKSVWLGAAPGRNEEMRKELVALFDEDL
jgi:peroxiredoxin